MRFSTIESPVPRIAAIRFHHFPKSKHFTTMRTVSVGGYVYACTDIRGPVVFTGRFYKHGHYTLDRTLGDVLEALRQLRLVNKAEIAVHERAAKHMHDNQAMRDIRAWMRNYARNYSTAALARECRTVMCEVDAEERHLKSERKPICPK